MARRKRVAILEPCEGSAARAPRTEIAGASGESGVGAAALYRLMAWLSPAYPVGAFSYSSGIEWVVESGMVTDAGQLQNWLRTVVTRGSVFCDAVFLVSAHRAASEGSDTELRAVAELAAAFASSKERHLETTAQGRAFLDATQAAWPCEALTRLTAVWDGPVAYPVAVGVASAGHGLALAPALRAYLQAVVANMISAGVRLIPLGQTDGLRIMAAVEAVIDETALRATHLPLEEVGGAAFLADVACMRHETQYTRLFRS